jgi:hypothetical protein
MWVSNKKENLPKTYFINVMVIQSNVLRMILGWDIPFVYPNRNCNDFLNA